MKEPLILSIDTSCDETSVAITKGLRVISNIISSQVQLHKKYGGVVPLIAKRAHLERIDFVLKEAIKRANIRLGKLKEDKISIKDLDAIAVTKGPGLAIALEVGVNKAKQLAGEYSIPLIEVNHMEGHLLSSLAQNSFGKSRLKLENINFPLLGLLVSGGHTEIILVKEIGKYERVGETLDDAMGEAYDKVARMLGLGYPGGKVLSDLAKSGEPTYSFSTPLLNDNSLNFSFSGLKTAVLYQIRNLKGENPRDGLKVKDSIAKGLTKKEILDLARSFEEKAIKHLTNKLEKAIIKYKVTQVMFGGGVMSNAKIRQSLRKSALKQSADCYFPILNSLYTDNAGMIGIAGYFKYLKKDFVTPKKLDRDPEYML